MATMEHVVKVNGIVVNIIGPTHKGYLVEVGGERARLIVDGSTNGRVLYRKMTGEMDSIPVRL